MPGLVLENNPALTNLQGLSSLSRVEGNLRISGNDQLVDLAGLERISSVGAMLDIENNAMLTSINALSAVTTVGIWHLSYQSIRISNNASLTRISIVNGLTSLPGEVMIENNASLTTVDGFSSLTQINGLRANLLITGNARLTSINGFAALTTIIGGGGGGVITISNNAALTNMNGFSSLNRINGGITGGLILSNNQALTEVDGLSQLLSITGGNFYLRVMDNPMLNRGCGLFPLLDNNGVGGDWCDNSTCPAITISGNGPNCTREIIQSGGICSPVVITGVAVNTLASMSFYPNPSNGEFQIQFANDRSGQYHLSLHDLTGSLVKEKSIDALDEFYSAQIDLKPLPIGTYFVLITSPGGIYMRRRLVITN